MASVRVSLVTVAVRLLLLAGVLHVSHCANCSQPMETMVQCFTDNHLTLPTNMDSQSPTSLSYFNEQLCKQTDDAAKAISCFFQFTIDCSGSLAPDLAGYLPSPNKTKELVTIMCRNYSLFDQVCYNNQSEIIATCTESQVEKIMKLPNMDYVNITCKSMEANYGCMKPALGSCGCQTYKVTDDVFKGPMWPDKCPRPQFANVQCDPKNPKLFLDSGSHMVPSAILLICITLIKLLF
ncbi:uncharacterized protein LOC131940926 [Physella acuta]|uniref:uncharacterized protein LOC131940926 n=1 Tax=Physella acuta TaxID=109671 RepID=UPI0027DE2EDE|nr:uncharacterized protein LOC131940926 [Physella acuta]